MKLFLFFVSVAMFSFLIDNNASPQQWRDHLPYHQCISVTENSNYVYCAAEGGGVIVYDKQYNSVEKLSKANGLSDIGVSVIRHDKQTGITLIAYENTNVDLLVNGAVVNMPYIKEKEIIGEKSIYSIYFYDRKAYLSCSFGIVVIDLLKKEVKEQYFIGEFASQLRVNDITTDNEYIYAATEQGVYRASLQSSNLIDYSQWSVMNDLPGAAVSFSNAAVFDENLFVLQQDSSGGQVWFYNENSWQLFLPSLYNGKDIVSLAVSNHHLSIVMHDRIDFFSVNDLSEPVFQHHEEWGREIRAGIAGSDQSYYLATNGGLVKTGTGSQETFYPNGPPFIDAYRMDSKGDVVWVAAGSPGKVFRSMGAYYFKDNFWHPFNRWSGAPGLGSIGNLSEVFINPQNPNQVWFGSLFFGLVEVSSYQVKNHYTDINSVMVPHPELATGTAVGVSSLAYDINNNLWILANWTNPPLYAYSNSGVWYAVEMNDSRFDNILQEYTDLVITEEGDKWFLFARHNMGLFVFNENQIQTKEDNFERYETIKNQDETEISRVFCMEIDKNDAIWVGTDQGPVVYYNPAEAKDLDEPFLGQQVKIPRNDGTGLADYLLSNEVITSIFIDGANRKWFGTESSGAYLISEDGLHQLQHFHQDNSPLLSNSILDITINDQTGEVFFATDKGLISYMGTATEPADDFADVYAFPNPVRPDYQGNITVRGLVDNCVVKITDISGNLVYETMATGGAATWNGHNLQGKRVATGVYIIFLSNQDGTKTHITKLLFIN